MKIFTVAAAMLVLIAAPAHAQGKWRAGAPIPQSMHTITQTRDEAKTVLMLRALEAGLSIRVAEAQIAPASTPSRIADHGTMNAQAGVMATRPATAPDAAPTPVTCPSFHFSTTNQPRIAANSPRSTWAQRSGTSPSMRWAKLQVIDTWLATSIWLWAWRRGITTS